MSHATSHIYVNTTNFLNVYYGSHIHDIKEVGV